MGAEGRDLRRDPFPATGKEAKAVAAACPFMFSGTAGFALLPFALVSDKIRRIEIIFPCDTHHREKGIASDIGENSTHAAQLSRRLATPASPTTPIPQRNARAPLSGE
jgi:hypothetical protein